MIVIHSCQQVFLSDHRQCDQKLSEREMIADAEMFAGREWQEASARPIRFRGEALGTE